MLDLIATVASGGATGILGSVVGGAFKWLDRREERREAADRRAHELRLQELQMRVRDAETENELAVVAAEASRDRLMASYAHDSASGRVPPWVASALRFVRPALTFGLVGLTAAIYFAMDVDAVVDGVALKAYIVNAVVYTTSAAVLWWFGDRAREMRK